MSPKEKAIELVEKMFSLSTNNAFPAKQCALIAVDEIFKTFNKYTISKQIEYWEQVKIEINKL
jgi:hypothetical protein